MGRGGEARASGTDVGRFVASGQEPAAVTPVLRIGKTAVPDNNFRVAGSVPALCAPVKCAVAVPLA
jgi:hypothetical protein